MSFGQPQPAVTMPIVISNAVRDCYHQEGTSVILYNCKDFSPFESDSEWQMSALNKVHLQIVILVTHRIAR